MTTAHDLVPISPRPELPFEARVQALEAAFSGRLGYHAVHLESGDELALRSDEPFPTASVIKVGLACALLDLVARGEASLDEVLPLPPRGRRVAGGGVLKQLDVERLSLRDLIELAICVSDNVADERDLRALRRRLGGQRLPGGARARRQRRMLGPIDFSRITHDADGGIGVSTPREQTRLLTLLQRDEILTPELCDYLRGVLGRQHLLDQLPRWLGWNTYAQYHGRDRGRCGSARSRASWTGSARMSPSSAPRRADGRARGLHRRRPRHAGDGGRRRGARRRRVLGGDLRAAPGSRLLSTRPKRAIARYRP